MDIPSSSQVPNPASSSGESALVDHGAEASLGAAELEPEMEETEFSLAALPTVNPSAASFSGGGGGGAEAAAAAAAGKKAREALSPEQKKELDEQTSDAAEEGDTAKVLKGIEDGGDIEWRNSEEVNWSFLLYLLFAAPRPCPHRPPPPPRTRLLFSLQDEKTALMRACYKGNTNTAWALVMAGANVEAKSNAGNTPLIEASYGGHLATVKVLVEEGHANVEAKSNRECTPLIWATVEGDLATVKFLVEEGHANVEAKDIYGDTPLMGASRNGHLATVKFLVEECHANVEVKNNDGFTALEEAKRYHQNDVVEYLRSKGATESIEFLARGMMEASADLQQRLAVLELESELRALGVDV